MLHPRQMLVKCKNGELVLQNSAKTKKGKRVVAVSPDVLVVLEHHRQLQEAERHFLGEAWQDSDLIFTSEVGTPVNPDNLRRVRNQRMDKAEVPRVSLHDLRHLHASVCINSGMDPATLADRLGHTRKSFTLDRYTHFWESQRAKSAVSLTDWLSPVNSPVN